MTLSCKINVAFGRKVKRGAIMSDAELRQHRVCFTGHRPEKLTQPEKEITSALEQEIRKSIDDGFTTFISGMARGVDIWAAEIVLKIRSEGKPIHLICASPFKGFESGWSADWRQRYEAILKSADLVKFICPSYSRACFQIRNKWMVDRSAKVIAVYNGEPGGTRNTIEYANTRQLQIEMV